MLGRVCPHLTLAARGARKEAILGHGLVLHSEYKGEITVHPETVTEISGMTEQDYIFVCVKNYSLEDVCREMDHAVTEDTVIIPVMNGVDPGDRIRSLISRGTVVDSLIYIVSSRMWTIPSPSREISRICGSVSRTQARQKRRRSEKSRRF